MQAIAPVHQHPVVRGHVRELVVCLLPILDLENPVHEVCEPEYSTMNNSVRPSVDNASLPAGLKSKIQVLVVCTSCICHIP